MRVEWAHRFAYKWKAKCPGRQCAISSSWPGEEKPLAARLSGVDVSLSSAIKYLPLRMMNHRITGETVHCCLEVSDTCLSLHSTLLPFATVVINPGSAPLSLSLLLPWLQLALYNTHCLLTHLCSHRVFTLLEWPNFLMDHVLQRHTDTHQNDLCAEDLIKRYISTKYMNKRRNDSSKTGLYYSTWHVLIHRD